MIVGIEDIIKSRKYGMTDIHMQAVLDVAKEMNTIIAVRPVSRFAAHFIEKGYPTKTFVVKNKTANIGVAAGLIVMNPTYCQVAPEDYDKYQRQLDYALNNDPDIKPVELVLNHQRIEELQSSAAKLFGQDINAGGIAIEKMVSASQATKSELVEYKMTWRKPSSKEGELGELCEVIATPREGTDDFLIVDAATRKPVMVLGKNVYKSDVSAAAKKDDTASAASQTVKTCLPITADYDLLVVTPSYADFSPGDLDRTPLSTQGTPERVKRSLSDSILEGYAGPKEDPQGGNWTPRTQLVTAALNKKIKLVDPNRAADGLETFHHNNEFHNPFADDINRQFPCLFVLPKALNLSSIDIDGALKSSRNNNNIVTDQYTTHIVLIENLTEFKKLSRIIRSSGYYFPTHSRYEAEGTLPGPILATKERLRRLSMGDLERSNPDELLSDESAYSVTSSPRIPSSPMSSIASSPRSFSTGSIPSSTYSSLAGSPMSSPRSTSSTSSSRESSSPVVSSGSLNLSSSSLIGSSSPASKVQTPSPRKPVVNSALIEPDTIPVTSSPPPTPPRPPSNSFEDRYSGKFKTVFRKRTAAPLTEPPKPPMSKSMSNSVLSWATPKPSASSASLNNSLEDSAYKQLQDSGRSSLQSSASSTTSSTGIFKIDLVESDDDLRKGISSTENSAEDSSTVQQADKPKR